MTEVTKIYVHQKTIHTNRKFGYREPAISVEVGGEVSKYHRVQVHGPSEIVYLPDAPNNGAHVWIETQAEVTGERDG